MTEFWPGTTIPKSTHNAFTVPKPVPRRSRMGGVSKTSRMRAALCSGPKTARELAVAAEIPPKHVRSYIKGDIDMGRVVIHSAVRPATYELVGA